VRRPCDHRRGRHGSQPGDETDAQREHDCNSRTHGKTSIHDSRGAE
jgi:hypothetical protein